MSVPFTFVEFLEMLERFNTDWWPAHVIVPVILVVYAFTGFVPVKLGVVEDIGLIAAGIVTGLLLVYRDRSSRRNKGEIIELN